MAAPGQLGPVVQVGCEVLIGWVSENAAAMNNQLDWYTLLATFDGAAAGPARKHPALSDMTIASANIEVAAGAGGAALLAVDENGCRFLPLDETGADRGPPVTLGQFGCVSLAGTAASFSLLYAQAQDATTPTTLLTVDGSGATVSSRPLADPPMRALWGRLVRSDGTFLLNTFAEDPSGKYTDWLQGFDSQGNALSSSVTTVADIAPVLLAETQRGALASWSFADLQFQPVDGTGAALGPAQSTPVSQSIYGETLAPMANGDVLATVLVLDSPSNVWTILVQERAPDGTERGGFSAFSGPPGGFQPDTVQVIVAPDGDHALLVYNDEATPGIHTLPIACAD